MAKDAPLVSCLCPTYGRPHLLREAIWCFLQQDYPNKELVVINDHHQPLTLDRAYPGVRLHNLPQRLGNLGQKRNYTVQAARGEFLLNWDDDDLYLPWRIAETVQALLGAPEKRFFKPTRAWQSTNNRQYRLVRNLFHAQAGMRRSLFDGVGLYKEMNSGQDAELEARIPRALRIDHPAKVSDLFYVYRWGNGVTHLSGFGMDHPGKPTGWERVAERCRNVAGGQIVPGFDRDYWQELLDDAAGIPEVDGQELDRLRQRLAPYHDLGPR